MRRVLLLAALASLGACKREPSFDERYAGARKVIGEKALELDRDMKGRASEEPSEAIVPESTGGLNPGKT
jgi:hypothetical protein